MTKAPLKKDLETQDLHIREDESALPSQQPDLYSNILFLYACGFGRYPKHTLSTEVMFLLKRLLIYLMWAWGKNVARATLFLRTKEYYYIILFILYFINFCQGTF